MTAIYDAILGVDPAVAWYGQAALALVVVFLLGVALALDWHELSVGWRRVVIVTTAQQVVIAYGSWEARQSEVDPELRVFLLTATLVGMILALALLIAGLVRHHRPT